MGDLGAGGGRDGQSALFAHAPIQISPSVREKTMFIFILLLLLLRDNATVTSTKSPTLTLEFSKGHKTELF